MRKHRKCQARESGGIETHVFVKPRTGKPLRNLQRSLKSALDRANIDKQITWHNLRHTTGSQMMMDDLSQRTMQEMLGKKSVQMTKRYSHLSPDYLRGIADRIGYRMSPQSNEGDPPRDTRTDTRPKRQRTAEAAARKSL